MQLNKNGIPIQIKSARQQRMESLEDKRLDLKRYALISDEAEVEVVVPHFSPIIDELKKNGWREIN